MLFTKRNVHDLIDAESQIDTLTQVREVNAISPKAYDLFRKALAQLQNDCEAQGIFGYWQDEKPMKLNDWVEKEIDQRKEIVPEESNLDEGEIELAVLNAFDFFANDADILSTTEMANAISDRLYSDDGINVSVEQVLKILNNRH